MATCTFEGQDSQNPFMVGACDFPGGQFSTSSDDSRCLLCTHKLLDHEEVDPSELYQTGEVPLRAGHNYPNHGQANRQAPRIPA